MLLAASYMHCTCSCLLVICLCSFFFQRRTRNLQETKRVHQLHRRSKSDSKPVFTLSTAWHGEAVQNFVLWAQCLVVISSEQAATRRRRARLSLIRKKEVTSQRSWSAFRGHHHSWDTWEVSCWGGDGSVCLCCVTAGQEKCPWYSFIQRIFSR